MNEPLKYVTVSIIITVLILSKIKGYCLSYGTFVSFKEQIIIILSKARKEKLLRQFDPFLTVISSKRLSKLKNALHNVTIRCVA